MNPSCDSELVERLNPTDPFYHNASLPSFKSTEESYVNYLHIKKVDGTGGSKNISKVKDGNGG